MGEGSGLNILILGVQVPFTKGGAELLVDRLRAELTRVGHTVDLVQLPFNALPKSSLIEQMSMWRALSVHEFAGRKVDLVIPTKFPSYLVRHENKIPWLVHQHRQVYELYNTRFSDFDDSPEDEALRQMVMEADRVGFRECRAIFTIAPNVSRRLQRYLNISSEAIPPPPPLGNQYVPGETGDYILSVGRLCSIKRVDLMIRALAHVSRRLKLKVAGGADEPAIEAYLKSEVRKHHLGERVEFLGRVSDTDLLALYANCFAVYYAPHDEDYGFVSIEARSAAKPVVTASDSGTVLDFIHHERNGLIAEPDEASIGAAFNRLLEDTDLYARLSFREAVADLTASWDDIVAAITSSLFVEEALGRRGGARVNG